MTNEIKLKIKNTLPYLLTLIILIGIFVFVPTKEVRAQTSNNGTCSNILFTDVDSCKQSGGSWTPDNVVVPSTPTSILTPNTTDNTSTTSGTGTAGTTPTSTTSTTTTTNNSDFQTILNNNFVCRDLQNFTVSGCFGQMFYWLLMVIPAYILWVAAYFFNVFAFVTLSGKLFSSSFLPNAWAVTRDLSNIFFILILLYISIRLILGLGGHDVKKMIGKVIIMALLINFSMFFTDVVIDSSNILAIIFYNKINVGTTDSSGQIVHAPYESATGERDIAGGLTGAFNPANQLDTAFFASAANINHIPNATNNIASGSVVAANLPNNPTPVSTGILFGIMLLSGTVMLVAAYAFFVSGISFLGRMIELFVLIIFSPFAFMSFTIPQLAGVEYIGWDAWLKRLLAVSFMAPIFMFFMYFIFMLIGANLFGGLITKASPPSFVENVLGIFLPATLIVVLLLKATDYAKKGSGKFGEVLMKGAQMVGGLAIGAATGGAALLGTSLIGGAAQRTLNNDSLRAQAAGDRQHFEKLGITDPKEQQKMQRAAQKQLASARKTASRSYDFRQTGIGKFAAKQTGMNIDRSFGIKALSTEQLKGGAAASYKRKTEKNEEIRKSYEMTPAAAEKYDAEQAEKFALRKTQYESDLDEAKENTSGSNNEELKAWEKQYQDDKEKAKKVAERAGGKFSEDKFRSDYETGSYLSGGQKITAPPKPKVKEFNEKEFKKAYEKGGDLSSVGLGKEVEAGSLEKARTFKDVNEDRRQAQAWHIDHPTSTMGKDGEEIKTGLRDLGRLFVEGMKETATSKGGIATAALTGIPTFGVGAAATIVGGGVLHALKTVIRAKALDENSWVPKKLGFAPDPNLAASVRKQTSASQKIVDILKDVEGGNKNIGKELKNVVSPSPTPPPTGNTHTPTH